MKPFAPPPIILATAGDGPCGTNGAARTIRVVVQRDAPTSAPTARVLAHSVINRGNRSRFDRFAQTCVGALGSRHTVRDVRSRRRSGRPCRSTRGASPARGKPGSRPWMGGDPTSVAMDGLPRRSGFPRQARCRQPDVAAVGALHSEFAEHRNNKLWSRHI